MKKITFACLATGDLYGRDSQYINNLFHMIKSHYRGPFEVICFTDRKRNISTDIIQIDCSHWHAVKRDGMRPTTQKIGLFNPQYVNREWIIYLDLTLIIQRDLGPLLSFMRSKPESLNIIKDWNYESYNSSVMGFSPEHFKFIYEAFRDGATYTQRVKGDQEFIFHHLNSVACTKVITLPESYVCSFKKAVRTSWKNPTEAKKMIEDSIIVKFHGHPRMHEAFSPLYRIRKFNLKALKYGMLDLPFSVGALERSWESRK